MILSHLFIHNQHRLQQQYDTETCVHEANYDVVLYLLTYLLLQHVPPSLHAQRSVSIVIE